MIDRRMLMLGAGATLAFAGRGTGQGRADPFDAIVGDSGARLGLAVHDTGNGRRLGVNTGERFALCSTFKAPLAAAILARSGERQVDLTRPIRFSAADLLDHAPAVRAALPAGALSIEQLCAAAVTLSDNSAANLLLPQLGGPTGLTRFFRDQGDRFTRLDREEPALNIVRNGEVRDTTTPQAMAALLERIFAGNALSAVSRQKLLGWMVESRTGLKRLRAGLPDDWVVGDKTGTSGEGYHNDIAVATPPGRKPIFIACYVDAPGLDAARADAIHARIGSLIGTLFA